MDTSDLKHHCPQQFNSKLEEIPARLLKMGGLVEQQLEKAILALGKGESADAKAVVSNDYKLNAYDVDIDERSTKILALRQPTASDLRLVLTVIKATVDLERIGDKAQPVARMAMRPAAGDHGRNLFSQIAHLRAQVRQMLHRALDANVLDLIWAAPALERIGDRCCNISEYVINFVKGKDMRHISLDQIKNEFC